MVLYQIRVLLVEGTLPEMPPLMELPDEARVQPQILSTAVGTEVDIGKQARNTLFFMCFIFWDKVE